LPPRSLCLAVLVRSSPFLMTTTSMSSTCPENNHGVVQREPDNSQNIEFISCPGVWDPPQLANLGQNEVDLLLLSAKRWIRLFETKFATFEIHQRWFQVSLCLLKGHVVVIRINFQRSYNGTISFMIFQTSVTRNERPHCQSCERSRLHPEQDARRRRFEARRVWGTKRS
jgi:hypothetical protein